MKADLIYFRAGGGHIATARALENVLINKGWYVNMIDFRDVIKDYDFVQKLTSIKIEDFYNGYMKQGWTYGSGIMLRIFQGLVRGFHGRLTKAVSEYWKGSDTDILVSLIPNLNQALYSGTKFLGKPYVTIMTDMEDIPPHFWMEQQDQYMIIPNSHAAQQASGFYSSSHIFQTSGLVVHPDFYELQSMEKEKFGLVCFGGYGNERMIPAALSIDEKGIIPAIICGGNDDLFQKMSRLIFKTPRQLTGFTQCMPYWMANAKFLIGKPGPGMIAQALLHKVPMLLDNHAVMVQERYNLDWVEQNCFGMAGDVTNPDDITRFLTHYSSYATAIASPPTNRAVFEIPDILEGIVKHA